MANEKTQNIILVVATGWGPVYGGVNSFNKGFCEGLGRFLKTSPLGNEYKVVCIVESCEHREISIAANTNNVLLIRLQNERLKSEQKGFFDKTLIINIKDENESQKNKLTDVKHIILHDITTGDLIKEKSYFPSETIWSAIHLMHFKEYEHLKAPDRYEERLKKIIAQEELFNEADYRFAVGPLLRDLLEKKLDKEVIELMPGLIERKYYEKKEDEINGVTFGRFDSHHDRIKLASLVIDSWKKLISSNIKTGTRFNELKVVGFDFSQEADRIKCKELWEECIHNFATFEYLNEKKLLDNILKESNVAFMLSRHEGFGLAGWEAIEAGIPLFITQNSGLYKYIEKYKNGSFEDNVCVIKINPQYSGAAPYHEEELNEVIRMLSEFRLSIREWINKAATLRSELLKGHTWENTAKKFLETVGVFKKGCTDEDVLTNNEDNAEIPHLELSDGQKLNTNTENTSKKDTWLVSEFPDECIENWDSLIMSHRTKILTIKSPNTYNDFRNFLEQFAVNDFVINKTSTVFNKTFIVFIMDFGGEYNKEFHERSLYNWLTLQFAFKTMFLLPPFGNNRAFTGKIDENKINEENYPGKRIYAPLKVIPANNALLRTLSSRVVILMKNYKQYLGNIRSIDGTHFKNLFEDGYTRLVEYESSNNRNIRHPGNWKVTSHHILMEQKPYLEYLGKPLIKDLQTSTNFDSEPESEAFGLYTTVRFDRIDERNSSNVQCYMIDEDKDIVKVLPLYEGREAYIKKMITLRNTEIEKSMVSVSRAARYFLANKYWKKNIKLLSSFWPDYEKTKSIHKHDFDEIEVHGFYHLTLPEFLNFPIIFPEEISIKGSERKKQK